MIGRGVAPSCGDIPVLHITGPLVRVRSGQNKTPTGTKVRSRILFLNNSVLRHKFIQHNV